MESVKRRELDRDRSNRGIGGISQLVWHRGCYLASCWSYVRALQIVSWQRLLGVVVE